MTYRLTVTGLLICLLLLIMLGHSLAQSNPHTHPDGSTGDPGAAWIMRKHPGCCGTEDCLRADHIAIIGGNFVVTTKRGVHTFPIGSEKPSDDRDWWVCYNLYNRPIMPRDGCFFGPGATA
jgi:hypothetical protein